MNKIALSIMATSLLTMSLQASEADLQKQIDELTAIVEKVETKSLSDKIKFSPELNLRADKFDYENNGITPNTSYASSSKSTSRGELVNGNEAYTKHYDPQLSVRLRLNMLTDITDNVKFTGRIGITHNSQNDQRICILSKDITASHSVAKTELDIDKAYLDYAINKNFIFSAGILPTSGGMSSSLIEDTPRKSVFPSLMFDMTSYGVAASANVGGDNWLRAILAKAYTKNADQFYYQCNRETIHNMDVAGLFFETKLPMMGDNTAYVGVDSLGKIKAQPYLGSTAAPESAMATAKSMGSIINYGTGLEVRSIAGGNFDAFAHLAFSKPSGNNTKVTYTPFSDDTYANGAMIDGDGSAFHIGTKYKVALLNDAKFGLEYNQGDKYWFSGTQGSEDVYNKLATRGNAVEVYYTQPWNRYVSSRLGFLQVTEDYTGSGWHFGEPAKKDAVQQNVYFMINAYF
ncbi:MAG: DUF3373 family protein [Sulfurimonas sp.]|nr:DUF3373 family protein [Sulfurimonas sp.]